MSIDILQERIRKIKSPLIVDLTPRDDQIPPALREEAGNEALLVYCRSLLDGLQQKVAGIRFRFDRFALMGALDRLSELMKTAMDLGYYVLLDGPSILSPWDAEVAADAVFWDGSQYPCHGMILSPWIGSDAIKPFLPYCKQGKSVFFAVRSANKTAAELQDLMTGSRVVHAAAADIVNRHAEPLTGKSGYCHVGVMTAGTNAASVSGLRAKYKRLFLLVDGIDYPGGNAKICSYAFDKFGHGAAVCAGTDILAAWAQEDDGDGNYVELAAKAAERLKANISRYVAVL